MAPVVPKWKAYGVDFCGTNNRYYLIRSDIGQYMRSENFNKAEDCNTYSLHPNCRGDHYLANDNGKFYIIQGNKYHRTTNMNKDSSPAEYDLHPRCQRGDFYMCLKEKFYIMYRLRGYIHVTINMNNDEAGEDVILPPIFNDGIYFWGCSNHLYFLKDTDVGLEYHKTSNWVDENIYKLHTSIIAFLPQASRKLQQILPKQMAPGIDFCGTDNSHYIIRPDFGQYMRSKNFNKAEDCNSYSLHPNCRGDHYLANSIGNFYIIQGHQYRRTTNMNKDSNVSVYSLHPKCQGGDFYMCLKGKFYIIYRSRDQSYIHVTTNMNNDEAGENVALPPGFYNGLYFWGCGSHFYYLKDTDLGLAYHKTSNWKEEIIHKVHADIISFLPMEDDMGGR